MELAGVELAEAHAVHDERSLSEGVRSAADCSGVLTRPDDHSRHSAVVDVVLPGLLGAVGETP